MSRDDGGVFKQCKIAVCGSGGVGKSSVTLQFVQNNFYEDYDPTIEDSYIKNTKIENETWRIEITDTAGQEEYRSLRDQYMQLQDGFVLVYSVTDRKSYLEVIQFVDRILRVKDSATFPMVLIANKTDLEDQRCVSREMGQTLADSRNIMYLECSAKTRSGVDEAFAACIEEIKKDRLAKKQKRNVRAKSLTSAKSLKNGEADHIAESLRSHLWAEHLPEATSGKKKCNIL